VEPVHPDNHATVLELVLFLEIPQQLPSLCMVSELALSLMPLESLLQALLDLVLQAAVVLSLFSLLMVTQSPSLEVDIKESR